MGNTAVLRLIHTEVKLEAKAKKFSNMCHFFSLIFFAFVFAFVRCEWALRKQTVPGTPCGVTLAHKSVPFCSFHLIPQRILLIRKARVLQLMPYKHSSQRKEIVPSPSICSDLLFPFFFNHLLHYSQMTCSILFHKLTDESVLNNEKEQEFNRVRLLKA